VTQCDASDDAELGAERVAPEQSVTERGPYLSVRPWTIDCHGQGTL